MLAVLRRAWRDTKQSIGLKWQTFAHYLAIPGLAVLLLWLLLGKQQAMDEIWIVGCYVAVAFLLFFFSFLWHLWLAPYNLMNDKINKLDGKQNRPRTSSPDYWTPNVDHWKGTKTFKLGDAASLWAGVRPLDPIEDDRAAGKFAELSGAVINGEIASRPGGLRSFFDMLEGKRPWPGYSYPISAIALRRYADVTNDVPPFLRSVEVPPEPAPEPEPEGEKGDKEVKRDDTRKPGDQTGTRPCGRDAGETGAGASAKPQPTT